MASTAIVVEEGAKIHDLDARRGQRLQQRVKRLPAGLGSGPEVSNSIHTCIPLCALCVCTPMPPVSVSSGWANWHHRLVDVGSA